MKKRWPSAVSRYWNTRPSTSSVIRDQVDGLLMARAASRSAVMSVVVPTIAQRAARDVAAHHLAAAADHL
ncbi:hypothetical protein [Burkholderia plantarii]|uniref:hypothetical protein n=1 Tax=Burkholderia plantarii TaxID=41899 RepID=UPI001F5B9C4A|nr:hypothetical protein [Burkholderia plantarii]